MKTKPAQDTSSDEETTDEDSSEEDDESSEDSKEGQPTDTAVIKVYTCTDVPIPTFDLYQHFKLLRNNNFFH